MQTVATAADVAPLRLIAHRLHRTELDAARLRAAAAPPADGERCREIRRQSVRRELLCGLEAARG
jgi:hypothetical protein